MDDDDEESINQIKGIPITEEHSHSKDTSHPTSPSITHSTSQSKRTISQIVIIEQSSKLVIDVQQFVFDTES